MGGDIISLSLDLGGVKDAAMANRLRRALPFSNTLRRFGGGPMRPGRTLQMTMDGAHLSITPDTRRSPPPKLGAAKTTTRDSPRSPAGAACVPAIPHSMGARSVGIGGSTRAALTAPYQVRPSTTSRKVPLSRETTGAARALLFSPICVMLLDLRGKSVGEIRDKSPCPHRKIT